MRFKTAVFFAAAVLCFGTLAGCSNNHDPDRGQVFVESEANKDADKILTFFAPADSDSTEAVNYKELIQRYNEGHTELEVTFEGIPTANGFNEYLEQRLDAGQGDDVFIINADSVKPLYTKGYLYDLSGLPAFAKLNDATRNQAMIGDIAYCIPVDMTAYVMFANLDLLEQYGLQPPQNLDELISCCRTIKAQGGTPFSLNRWFALTVPAMANGLYKIYKAENSEEIINQLNNGEAKIGDYMLEGFQLFQTAVEEGWYGDGLNGAAVDALKAGEVDFPDFIDGKTVFLFGSLGGIERIEKDNPALNFQAQGIPIPDGTVTLPSVVSRLSVNANSKYLDDSLDFVSYITNGAYQKNVQSGNSYLPIYDEADFTPKSERMLPAYNTFLSGGQIPIEDMQLKFNYWDTIRELCIAMFDGMSAEEASEKYNQIQLEQIAAFKN